MAFFILPFSQEAQGDEQETQGDVHVPLVCMQADVPLPLFILVKTLLD